MMKFTFQSYISLLSLLKDSGYNFCSYHNWEKIDRCVILRHDIDYNPYKAVEMAEIEHNEGVTSTYFVLLTSDFYNPFSESNGELWRKIREYGHEIGLHFDEARYHKRLYSADDIKVKILEEADQLGKIVGVPVKAVSMHRPSKMVLESNLSIPGVENSYGNVYFKEFKYLSDSRRCWREPVEQIVGSCEYNRLHILTHSIWYGKDEEGIHDTICGFVNNGNRFRYEIMKDNITDLESIMLESEVK